MKIKRNLKSLSNLNELRGQSFKSGFISGVVGKVGGHYAVKYGGNPIANASIIGVFSGIASRATGGDFYEGAIKEALSITYYIQHRIVP